MLKKNYDFKIPVFVLEQGKLKVILEHAPIWWGSDDKIIYDNLIFMIPPVTFKEVFEEIGDDSFALCNQCYLVNLKYVNALYKKDIEMTNGEMIPLSRHYKKEFEAKYIDLLQDTL